jgi:hypothetical protein
MRAIRVLLLATILVCAALPALGAAADQGLIFYLPFEQSLEARAAAGDSQPAVAEGVTFAQGVRGLGAAFGKTSSLAYATSRNLNKAEGTLEFWIKPEWPGSDPIWRCFFIEDGPYEEGENTIRFWHPGALRFDPCRTKQLYYVPSTNWQPQQWHHLAATWNHQKQMSLYVDGALVTRKDFSWPIKSHERMYVGSPNPWHRDTAGAIGAEAVMDELRIYRRALSDDEVLGRYREIYPLAVKARAVYGGTKPLPVTVEMGGPLFPYVRQLRFGVKDAQGKSVLQRTIPYASSPGATGTLRRAQLSWPVAGLPSGDYTLTIAAVDRGGKTLGTVTQTTYIAHQAIQQMFQAVRKTDIGRVARTQPFRAAAYVGAVVCADRFLRAVEKDDPIETADAYRAFTLRMDVLADGKLDATGDLGLYRLLALTGNPDAQVIVEYFQGIPQPAAAATFYWGSIPVTTVYASQFADAEAARKAFESPKGLVSPSTSIVVAGRPGRVITRTFSWTPCTPADVDPSRQVFLANNRSREIDVLDTKYLPSVRVDSAVILADCPARMRREVEAWAAKRHIPLLRLADAGRTEFYLIAGDIRVGEPATQLGVVELYRCELADRGPQVIVVDNDRLLSCAGGSRPAQERAVELVMAGQPVTVAEADELRARTVAAFAPKVSPPAWPEGQYLFGGDLHVHSTASDGKLPPVAMALQGMYCNMDFMALTDHNRVDSAQLVRRLFAEHHIGFPFIVGEEITTAWSHFTAYPLREVVPWTGTFSDITKAVHSQGGVIQWNHPGYPYSPWAMGYLRSGIDGTSLDAWEHYSELLLAWQGTEKMPVVTGTTDTHSGTFDDPERTIILGPTAGGDDVAEAIRGKQVAALLPNGPALLYGRESMTNLVWAALAEGKTLKAQKAAQITKALENADFVGLLRAYCPEQWAPPSLDR